MTSYEFLTQNTEYNIIENYQYSFEPRSYFIITEYHFDYEPRNFVNMIKIDKNIFDHIYYFYSPTDSIYSYPWYFGEISSEFFVRRFQRLFQMEKIKVPAYKQLYDSPLSHYSHFIDERLLTFFAKDSFMRAKKMINKIIYPDSSPTIGGPIHSVQI